MLSFSLCAKAQGDTSKVKYDINDPRNPDCPCHQYQKLAEQEYQQMIANEALDPAIKGSAQLIQDAKRDAPDQVGQLVSDVLTNENKVEAVAKTETVKTKKIRASRTHVKSHKNKKPKKRKVRFSRKDNSRCTHW